MVKKKKKKNNFFHTLQPILIFSFIVNIILLGYIYYLKSTHHIYFFSGKNEYVSIDTGNLSMNYDINYLMGNNIEYVGEEDIKIKEIKVGYYIMEDDKLNEIIKHYEKFDEATSLSDTLKSINDLNVSESAREDKIFKNINGKDLETKIYFVMEIKKEDNESIVSKLPLDIAKVR